MKTIAVCAGLALICLLLVGMPAPAAQAQSDEAGPMDEECDPYPIGRCGAYQRESLLFCYVMRDGLYTSATDDQAVGLIAAHDHLGQQVGHEDVDHAAYYIRQGPTNTFVDDPMTAPFPFKSLYEESNVVPGLQPEPFNCGKWTWFAECEPQQWMGPTGVISKQPDTLLV